MASKPGTSPDKNPDHQSFGYPGQGGYDDFRTRDIDDAPVMDAPPREATRESPLARPGDRRGEDR